MSHDQAARPAAVRGADLRDVAGRGPGWGVAGWTGAGTGAHADSADRHRADPTGADHLIVIDFYHACGADPCRCFGFDPGDDWPDTSDAGTAVSNPRPVAQTDETHTPSNPIPAAGADSIPDAGSDPIPATAGPDLCEWCGQWRWHWDDLRGSYWPDFGDGPGVPRGGGRPDGAVHDDDLQRAGDVGRSLQRDRERRRGDPALLRDGRWSGLRFGDTLRRLGTGRDAGRADLYLVGIKRRHGESLQWFSQRRWGPSDLSGGLT